MRWIKGCNGSSRGQTLVEFALIAPFILILLVGVVDFSVFLNHRITMQHAVREGARYAAVTTDCEAIEARTAERAGSLISDSNTVVVSYSENPADAGDTVTVSAPFQYDFPLIGRFGVDLINGHVSASARLELAVPIAEGCP